MKKLETGETQIIMDDRVSGDMFPCFEDLPK